MDVTWLVLLVAAVLIIVGVTCWLRQRCKLGLRDHRRPEECVVQPWQPLRTHPSARQVHSDPAIWVVDDFLSAAECEHMQRLAAPRLQRSTVLSDAKTRETNVNVPSNQRTSSSAYLDKAQDAVIADIEARGLAMLGDGAKPRSHVEPLQVGRYRPSEFYSPHFDYFLRGTPAADATLAKSGQRTHTMLLYLNDLPDDAGGETSFTRLGVRVRPRRGRAVLWCNVDPRTSREDERTHHGGDPPRHDATKWISNFWVRARPYEG